MSSARFSSPVSIRNLRVALALGLFLAVLVPAQAFAAPAFKVAYVDLQKALASSKAGREAQKTYEAEVKSAQSEIDEKKLEFEQLKKSFQKQRDTLNEEARLEKEEELIQLERDLQRQFKDAQDKLRRKNTILVGDLVKELRDVVGNVGRERGFTVILERGSQAVLYADDSIDITDDVVEQFDAKSR